MTVGCRLCHRIWCVRVLSWDWAKRPGWWMRKTLPPVKRALNSAIWVSPGWRVVGGGRLGQGKRRKVKGKKEAVNYAKGAGRKGTFVSREFSEAGAICACGCGSGLPLQLT